MRTSSSKIALHRIDAKETIPMRLLTVRAGKSEEDAVLEGDDDPNTRHYGAFEKGVNVGVVTLLRRDAKPEALALMTENHDAPGPEASYQLRAMGTHPERRAEGIGKALVDHVTRDLNKLGASLIWCNVRTNAIGFYRNCGFHIVGEEFELPHYGPHRVGYLWL